MSFECQNICQQVNKPVSKKIRKIAFFWPLSVYTPLSPVLACKINCNQRNKIPPFNHEPILSKRSVQNFNKISALVFEKSCPPTSKIHFLGKRV